MVGLYDPQAGEGSAAIAAQGVSAIPSSTGEVLGAEAGGAFDQAFDTLRAGRQMGEMGIGFPEPGAAMVPPIGAVLAPDEANAQYGIKGRLAWKTPVPEDVAREQNARMHDTVAREDVINRREGGLLTGGAARFAAGMIGGLPGLADPTNIAASFFPVVGEARAALWAARLGLPGRALTGAIEGAAGQAALTPLQYGLSRQDHEDFGATDALLNIALGGVFGGGLHTAGGLLGRAGERAALTAERAAPEAREDLLRGAVADIADGRPVETPATLQDAGAFDRTAYIREEPGGARPYDRVPPEPQRLVDFLRERGGMVDEGGELSARDMLPVRRRGGLINPEGMSHDEAALIAWEEGYLPGAMASGERPTPDDLRAAIGRDLGGDPVYSDKDHMAAAEFREALDRNAEIDRLSQEHGIPVSGKTRDQFYQALAEKLGRDGAAGEAERLAAQHAAIMRQADAEGWMPDFFGEPRGNLTAEDIAREYQQDLANRRAEESAYGIERPETDGRTAGAAETGDGQGGRGAGARRRQPGEDDAGDAGGGEQPGEPGHIPRELSAEADRPASQALADQTGELDRELREAGIEGGAELEQAQQAADDIEAFARACEQSAACLARQA